jgi:hypothetical protein
LSHIYLTAKLIDETIHLCTVHTNINNSIYSSMQSEWWEYFDSNRLKIEDFTNKLIHLHETAHFGNNNNNNGLSISNYTIIYTD